MFKDKELTARVSELEKNVELLAGFCELLMEKGGALHQYVHAIEFRMDAQEAAQGAKKAAKVQTPTEPPKVAQTGAQRAQGEPLATLVTAKGRRKTCVRCGTEKPTDEYGPHANAKDGLQPWCRECQKEYGRKRTAKKKKYGGRMDTTDFAKALGVPVQGLSTWRQTYIPEPLAPQPVQKPGDKRPSTYLWEKKHIAMYGDVCTMRADGAKPDQIRKHLLRKYTPTDAMFS